MKKHTFRYCLTHRADEAYMQQMCARGWAALRLTEGFWTFEPCEPGAYCYRICYLRGMSPEEIRTLKDSLSQKGIQFVSRYSFWAIFRSREDFRLYTPQEEQQIIRKIYAPMPAGAVLSWLIAAAGLYLTFRFSPLFLLLALPLGLYGSVCTCLALAYRRLL